MRRIPRLASVLAPVALATGLTMAGTAPARAAVIPPAGWIPIHNPYLHAKVNTLRFEDSSQSITVIGTPVQLGHCHGYAADGERQRWAFTQITDGSFPSTDSGYYQYLVSSLPSGSCLNTAPLGSSPFLGRCTESNGDFKNDAEWELRTANGPAGTGPDFMLFSFLGGRASPRTTSGDNIPTRLAMARCDPNDTRQLFNLG